MDMTVIDMIRQHTGRIHLRTNCSFQLIDYLLVWYGPASLVVIDNLWLFVDFLRDKVSRG